MSKTPKKAQVAFNQFIFDTMMQKIREVELLEKKVAAHEELLKVHVQKIGEHGRHVAVIEDRMEYYVSELNRIADEDRECVKTLERRTTLVQDVVANHSKRIAALEKEIKDQREDYHAHIRQLVEENEAAHKTHSAELSQVAADTNKGLLAFRQINNVAREVSNRQAAAIETLQTQMKNLLVSHNGLTNTVLNLQRARDAKGRYKKKE